MQNPQKKSPHVVVLPFIDYRPAELVIKTQWLVVFYAKNPITKKLERFRLSVPALKSKTERMKHGKKIVLEVNKKLDSGWLPYYDNTDSSDFKTFAYCCDKFLEITAKDVANGSKREDTNKSYKSGISMLKKFISEKKLNVHLMLEINKPFIMNYLDWIFYERKVSGTTHNNHVVFIGVFFSFCVDRGFCKQNFAIGIKKKKKEEKKRKVFPDSIKAKLKDYGIDNIEYYTLCMMTYYCFIRNTELTKLRVMDVNLQKNYITVLGAASKNKKTANITIPENYKMLIKKHIENAKPTDYIFSANNFKAGSIQLGTKKIYDTWCKFKKVKNIPDEFQFYSLKDTGITDLTSSGVALIKVRDQARHFDIKITETYMSRNQNCDDFVRNANVNF